MPHADPRPRGSLPVADDGGPSPARAPGARAGEVARDMQPDRDGLSAGGATLVRPDGVIAWRRRRAASRDELSRALATALALSPDPAPGHAAALRPLRTSPAPPQRAPSSTS